MNKKATSTGKFEKSRSKSRRGAMRSNRRRNPKWIRRIAALVSFPFRRLLWGLKYWKPFKILSKRFEDICRFVVWLAGSDTKQKNLGETAARLRHLDWPSRKALLNPAAWGEWFVSFVARWGLTRPKRSFVLAIPAIVFTMTLLTCLSLVGRRSIHTTTLQYLSQMQQAGEKNDAMTVRFIADALIRLDPSEIKHRFHRAAVEEQFGNPTGARMRLSRLAIHDKSPVAAVLLANSMGDAAQVRNWPREKIQEYFDLLVLATKNAPRNSVSRRKLSDLLETLGDKQLAYAALLPVAENDPDTAYHVVRLEFQAGHTERARMRAQQVLTALQSALSKQPNDHRLRIQCASLHTLLDHGDSAVRLLRDGIEMTADVEAVAKMKRVLAEALAIDAEYLGKKDDTDSVMIERLRRLKEALDVDPTIPAVYEAIAKACLDASDSQNPEIRFRRETLVRRVDPETSRFIKGTAALQRGNLETAKELLAANVSENADAPGLLNNLAHALSQGANPDLEKALELSNKAIASVAHPYFRETRGQILFKMERFREAIADLEYALSSEELRPGIRPTLAQAYAKVGEPQQAQLQRDLLQQETTGSGNGSGK